MRTRRQAAVPVLLLAACAGTRGDLNRCADIPELHPLKVACDDLRNEEGHVLVGTVAGQPVRIFYRHTRAQQSRGTVVLIHGLLSNRHTWTFVAGDLGQDHDLLIIDLKGCGDSDKPDPADAGPTGYSPTALAREVLEVIRQRTDGRVTVVGHSLGGMVPLRMLGAPELRREYADVVGRIDRAVLMSTPSFAVERVHPVFRKIAEISDFAVAIGDLLEVLEERAARAVHDGTCAPARMPREEADRLEEALRRRATRRAAQAMIRQAVPFTADERPDWPAIERLVADYDNIDVPCLVIFGARDETFSYAVGHMLKNELPDARLVVLPARMHQLTVEAPRECAWYIRHFAAGERVFALAARPYPAEEYPRPLAGDARPAGPAFRIAPQ